MLLPGATSTPPNLFHLLAPGWFFDAGHGDVVIDGFQSVALRLLPGDGQGGFGQPVAVANACPDPEWLLVGDVDHDGRDDPSWSARETNPSRSP